MKKILSIALSLAIVLSTLTAFTVTVSAEDLTYGDFTYTLDGENAIVTGYTGTQTAIVIPAEIDGHTVIEVCGHTEFIGFRYHYSGFKNVISVMIPETVEKIGDWAFYECDSLSTITLPKSVKTIGGYAFSNCSHLVKVNMNEGLESIGEGAFAGSELVTVEIPDSVTCVYGEDGYEQYGAFENCASLASVKLGNSLKEVAAVMFRGCSNLRKVTLGESIESICDKAFYDCSNLTAVEFNNSLKTIGEYAFSGCSNLTEINLNDGLQTIGEGAFSSCGLVTVEIPDSVTSINGENNYGHYGAFENCVSLVSVKLGNALKEVAVVMFRGCSNLKNVTLGESTESICDEAFYGCENLSTIEFNNALKAIGDSAFSNCYSLTSITLPDSVKTISDYAFSNCSNLAEINLNDGLQTIGGCAFSESGLITIEIPDSVTSIYSGYWGDQGAFEDCASLVSAKLGNSMISVPTDIFQDCTNLKTVEIGANAVSIDSEAFYNCESLKTVIFNNSIVSIDSNAFYNCDSLKQLIFPDSLATIKANAVMFCDNLETVHISPETVAIDADAFYGSNEDLTICSTTEDCYAKTFADENGYNFVVCNGEHPIDIDTDTDQYIIPEDQHYDEQGIFITDDAGLLTNKELKDLNDKLAEIYERQNFIVAIATTNTFNGKDVVAYSDDLFEERYSTTSDGAILTINMTTRDWYISTQGYGITALTDYGIDYMGDQFVPDLAYGKYYEGFNKYADLCDEFVTEAKTNEPYDYGHEPETDIESDEDTDFGTDTETETDIETDTDTEIVSGDLNGDTILDIIDVAIARAYIVGSRELSAEEIKAGDMNGDGVLDIIDVVMMRKAIVG